MHRYISWIGLIALINYANAVPLSGFISFGRSAGDRQFSRIYRAASFEISITPEFPYFNGTYSEIYVSSHGYVTFSGRTAYIRPVGFPFQHPLLSVICPFWANIDQTISGTTYYRKVSSSSRIDKEIRKYFSDAKDFTTKWALIATWEKVGYYNRHADKVNTFQVVVATNGSRSYAIFNYLDNGIQWSSADNTGGVNGIGPFGAQVGFNGGDGVHYFVRPETQNDVLELDDNSNVCVPGKYVFRIDGETVQPGRCVNIKQDMCSKDIGKDTSSILMVSNRSNIVTVNLDTNVVGQYGVDGYIIFAISFDLVNRMLYWSEINLGVIRRVSFDDHLNGSAVETIVTGLSTPEQIAVDWVNRKLYWTDHRRGVIERSNLDGTNIEVIVNIEIVPQAIVVDPFHKTIYWVNYYSVPRTIQRLSTNGLIKHTILNVARPSGLTIDYDNNLLYWTDTRFNRLYSSDLAGNNIKIVPVSVVITQPYAITVFQSKLYWTDRLYSHINIVNQFTGVSQGSISASLNRPTGIQVIDYSRQPGVLRPFIIKDTFLHCITVLAPESFTISVEFVAICMDFNVTWEFKGNQLVDGLNVKIVNTSLGKSQYKASLTILQSSEEDSGTYTLTVTSATGSDSVKIIVKIINYCTPSTIQDAYLLFTDYNSINRINLDGTKQQIVVSNLYNIHGMDFDILTNMVYWCEVNEGTIYRASIDCDGKELVVSGLVNPEEVAIDWINRKLYWCDFRHDIIGYSSLDGTNQGLLVNSDLDQPRGLVIDPFFGHIYWTDWGANPKIEKITLSGRNRHVIVSFNLLWPNCLTIDFATRKLYWVDAGYDTVETSDLEGVGRKILFGSPHPFGITVFNSILYWTDWTNDSIVSADINGGTTKNITNELLRPSNIHVVHYSVQPGAWYPYIIKDTFIECVIVQTAECFTLSVEFISCCNNFTVTWQFKESYIVSTDKYVINTTVVKHCHYKTSLTVPISSDADTGNYTITVTSATGSDSVTISVNVISECTPSTILQDPYLLFTDYNTIERINLDGTNQRTVVSNVFNVHGMDIDILTNTVYWCEVDEGKIYRASIDCDGKELIVSGLVNPEEVAIDWINRKLYWCDFGTDTIEYSKLDGTNRKLLLNTNVDQPRGLAIDPFSGHIYWTDWGDHPKIEKMTLTGENRRTIVGSDLDWPNGLTIDFTTSKLYWVDASLDKVEVSDLEGRGRQILYSGRSVPHPFGIAVYNGKLYFTDWSYRAVTLGSTDGSATIRNLTYGIRPSNIHVVHHSVQPGACGANCSCLSNEPYIFVSNDTSIEKRTLSTSGSTWTTLVDASTQPLAIDVDSITCKLFWSTGTRTPTDRKGEIKAVSLIDGSSTTIHSGLGYPEQIAVHWIARKIYWSDTTLLTIEYSDLDGANRQILLNNVVRVVAIALDPRVNVIYWVSKEHDFVISKLKLDGTSKRVIISNDLDSPNSLAIDFTFNRLYWTDGPKIRTSDLEGGNISTVFTTQSRRPTGLSVYDNVLFWAEWKFDRISISTTDGNTLGPFIDNVKIAAAIRVLHRSVQPRSCYDTYDSQGAK